MCSAHTALMTPMPDRVHAGADSPCAGGHCHRVGGHLDVHRGSCAPHVQEAAQAGSRCRQEGEGQGGMTASLVMARASASDRPAARRESCPGRPPRSIFQPARLVHIPITSHPSSERSVRPLMVQAPGWARVTARCHLLRCWGDRRRVVISSATERGYLFHQHFPVPQRSCGALSTWALRPAHAYWRALIRAGIAVVESRGALHH
jgi:hypothetical protein